MHGQVCNGVGKFTRILVILWGFRNERFFKRKYAAICGGIIISDFPLLPTFCVSSHETESKTYYLSLSFSHLYLAPSLRTIRNMLHTTLLL